MKLKTFTADSMPEALALVRAALGSGAVVLHTRTFRRGGFMGLGGRRVVEITASGPLPPAAPARAAKTGQPSPRSATTATHLDLPPRRVEPEPAAGDLIRRTYHAAKAELARAAATRENASAARTALREPLVPSVPRASQPGPPASPAPRPTGGLSAARPSSRPPAALPARREPAAAVAFAPAGSVDQTAALMEEMRSMRRMVGGMLRQQRGTSGGAGGGPADMPGKLFDQYLELLRQEVAEELAEEVVQQVRGKLSPAQLENEAQVRQASLQAIARYLPTDDAAGRLVAPADGRPRTIALIGPTGVGKTTTLAKLAATFKIKHKKSVGLITLDTYRIAAVEQLKTYANIIGLPLHVVVSPEELADALRRLRTCDVVLIDTAGRSQRDDPRLEQLRAFLQAADPHEVHLVLSSTCTESVLLETIHRFSAVRADRMIFTKLDEAVSFGVLLNVARKVNKRLSYITTGQEVPHQIEPGRAERLAALVLGGAL